MVIMKNELFKSLRPQVNNNLRFDSLTIDYFS